MKIPQLTRGLSLGLALFTLFLGGKVWAGYCQGDGVFLPNADGSGVCSYNGVTVPEGSAPPLSSLTPEERAVAQRRAEAAEYQRWLKQESQIIGKDIWGAVALAVTTTNENKVGSNSIIGQFSRAEAEQKVLANCKTGGGLDCRILVTFKNTCVAVADTGWAHQGATPVAIARAGATKREAYNNAMRACQALMDWDGSGQWFM